MSFDLKCGGRIVWAKHVIFLMMAVFLVVVVVVVVVVRGGNLKKSKSWRGVGGEGAAPPPQMHR